MDRTANDKKCMKCLLNDGGGISEQCLHCRHLMAYTEPNKESGESYDANMIKEHRNE